MKLELALPGLLYEAVKQVAKEYGITEWEAVLLLAQEGRSARNVKSLDRGVQRC
jgi:hypothetical protein